MIPYKKSQTLQDIVEQPADTSAISILKNHYTKINPKDGKRQLIPREQEGISGSPVKTIGSEVRKSKERTEMSQSSAVTLKKIFPASGERKSPDWKMEELSKGRKTLKAAIRSSQVKRTSLFHLKLKGVQSHREDPLSGLAKQIEVVSSSLTARDYQIVLTTGRNQKALVSTELDTRDDPKQLEIRLVEKMPGPMSVLRGSSWNEKLGQLEALDQKMEELSSWRDNLKADIKSSQREVMSLLDQKLEGVQSQQQDPLQGMGREKALPSMELATKHDLQELEICLEEKLSGLMSILGGRSWDENLGQQETLGKKMEEQLKADIKNSLGVTEMHLDEKLGSVQTHLEVHLQNPLLVLQAQIIQLRNQLSSIDEKVSQEGEKKKKEISHLEKKLEQLMNTEKKMEEQLKAEIKNSLGATEMLLDEKLGSVQTQLEARLQNPLSGLETQIKQLTNQLSSTDQKVSQEIEKKLQPIHSMQFASRDDLKQWKDLLEKKLSTSQPTLEISHLEEKLEQLEKSEKKMEEQLKVEIKNSLKETVMLLDEKFGSVQTHLEAQLQNPLSGLETQIKQLTNQLSSTDQKISQEIEKKLQTIHSMQLASIDELKQWKGLLEKKLSTSQPTLEISHLEKNLEQLEKSHTEKCFKAGKIS
ncbi:hypothetical protein KIL84_001793, partial [Mauremys mutica]